VSLGNSICYIQCEKAFVLAVCFRVEELEVVRSGDILVEHNCLPGPAEVVPRELTWLSREAMQCNGIAI